ncbi:hypothetical protein Kfla_2189 [Kribbella flavida DSM 17836]|uniref:DUF2637 domain-containing protein n=1 Tax=Kribbella flavida (strain DSM 17836 / JCM 10339 / NBRC 14399) TaxID=479435 RepID=D2PTF5_KRIFD|nr:DUF2637 domain-containing protein [Kribbella flavida]ADB31268.1 hypothetical protein Kfla_2189 [Kribbella flavida DSM 17836]
MTAATVAQASAVPGWVPAGDDLTGPMIAAGLTALVVAAAMAVAIGWLIRRAARSVAQAGQRGAFTGRRVLITVAIVAASGVAVIGGVRSFGAVSVRFNSPLVPLVADGMIVACTALRLAALTRGWRIPGALVTTYVFIGGTVWLNVDTAAGIADAVAHALAPLAYAVLVEMLAHLLRLHMKLAQPARPRLSALTWFTSPVITTRVWLHLSRTGTDDPVAARALVQQVVRMASRLATLCPSRKLWPFDAARAARSACLQTIRDGLLSASELAALLPAGGRLTPGELLALVDSAALGLTTNPEPDKTTGADTPRAEAEPAGAPLWLVAYLLGALRSDTPSAPVHHATRTAPAVPVHGDTASGAPAPRRADETPDAAPRKTAGPSDAELLDAVVRHAAEHGGAPLGQREIRRVTEEAFGRPVGFPRAKRLQEMAGWAEPTEGGGAAAASGAPQIAGQLQLVTEAGKPTPATSTDDDENGSDETTTDRELETSTR